MIPSYSRLPPEWAAILGLGCGSAFLAWFVQDDFGARLAVSRAALLFVAAWSLTALALCRDTVRRIVVDFFTTPMHPLTLSIFRIVVFWQASTLLWTSFIMRISSLPNSLQYPPGTGIPEFGLLARFAHWPLHPLGPDEVALGFRALRIVCFTGMIGLFSRTSAIVTSVLLFGVWGVVQWYGKVDHHHHIVWFTLLLGVSRCGDALSVDALVAAWRRARAGVAAPPGRHVAYRLPIAFALLLVAIIYLFPGLAKVWTSGLDWALSENPRYVMYIKWHFMGGWLPVMRFDHHPWLYRSGALFTLFFELTMILWIWGKRTRMVAAGMGLSFHAMTQLTMQISFRTLRNCYVIFFDWREIAEWIGRRLFPQRLAFAFDPRSIALRRAVASLRTLDLLGRVEWRAEPGRVVEAGQTGRRVRDAAAWRAVLVRIPLAWPLLPLARWFPRRVEGGSGSGGVKDALTARARPLALTAVVGASLVVGNMWSGALRMMDHWPLACYPLFNIMEPDYYDALQIDVLDRHGGEREISAEEWREVFGAMWTHLLRRIVAEREPIRQRERLRGLFAAMSRHDPTLWEGTTVRFSTVRTYTQPERWDDVPQRPELIFELPMRELLKAPGSTGHSSRGTPAARAPGRVD